MSETINLHERIQSRRAVATPADDDADSPEDRRSYGLLRGNKERAVMLTFRLQDGSEDAYPLTLLERVYFHPSQGITIRFVGVLVQLEGENLGATPSTGVGLLEGLLQQRKHVKWSKRRSMSIFCSIPFGGAQCQIQNPHQQITIRGSRRNRLSRLSRVTSRLRVTN
jgi:hypothetical protein